MRSYRIGVVLAILVSATVLWSSIASANKSSVTIKAPAEAHRNSEVTIVISITHNANSFFHHTEWVYVMVNGKELERWQYSASDRPPGEVFSKEVKVLAAGDLDIKAEASCNMHGSAGPVTFKVAVKD
jgi:desulfoferrodoxin (superoxide reductase-like protein)